MDGELLGRYDYDPYGNEIQGGLGIILPNSEAANNNYRFSTKPIDVGGLYYFGYRYYSPGLGRWISRDPIEERGGINLGAFVLNNSIHSIDPLGENGVTHVYGPIADIVSWLEGGPGYGTLINAATNPPPPGAFGEIRAGGVKVRTTIGQYLAKKEFRNHLAVTPGIKCCGTELIDGSAASTNQVGYTNPPAITGTAYFEGHGGRRQENRDIRTGFITSSA